jgi:hypothetical protein
VSSAWSKWINGYLRDRCGIEESTKVFHSFRHTFKRMARDANLYEELHDAITGLSSKDSVGRDYGRGFSIKPLSKAMAQIEPPVGLVGTGLAGALTPSPHPSFSKACAQARSRLYLAIVLIPLTGWDDYGEVGNQTLENKTAGKSADILAVQTFSKIWHFS